MKSVARSSCKRGTCGPDGHSFAALSRLPLAHSLAASQAVKHSLITSLVLAFGVMILSHGLFHSDP